RNDLAARSTAQRNDQCHDRRGDADERNDVEGEPALSPDENLVSGTEFRLRRIGGFPILHVYAFVATNDVDLRRLARLLDSTSVSNDLPNIGRDVDILNAWLQHFACRDD